RPPRARRDGRAPRRNLGCAKPRRARLAGVCSSTVFRLAFIIRGSSSDPSTLSMLFRLKLLVLTVAAAAIGFCGWLFWFALSPIELPAPTLDFSIREGSTLRGATRQLVDPRSEEHTSELQSLTNLSCR